MNWRTSAAAIAIVFAGSLAADADVTVATISTDAVRTYDENTVQLNAVDASLGAASLTDFASSVADAWDRDAGGVLNFDYAVPNDDGSGFTRGVTEFDVRFGSSMSKSISFTNADGTAFSNRLFSGRTPISGNAPGASILAKNNATGLTTNDFVIDVGAASSGEVVKSIGITLLSRVNNDYEYTVEATFNDGTKSAPLSKTFDGSLGAGGDDTLFVINAPGDLWITQFAAYIGDVGGTAGGFGGADDLAFIVGRRVPEPGGASLLLAAMMGVFSRRGQRASR